MIILLKESIKLSQKIIHIKSNIAFRGIKFPHKVLKDI